MQSPVQRTAETYVFVGSFVMPTPGEHDGLHVFRADAGTGALTPVASYVPGLNVGSFALDRRRGVLYVTDEVASTAVFRAAHGSAGGGGGRVFAFAVDEATGRLTELGRWPSFGTQPAGVALDATGGFLVVSHFTSRATTTAITGDRASGFAIAPRYDDAATVLFGIDADGRLSNAGAPADVCVHPRQGSRPPACLHSVTCSPDGSLWIECDMARDQLVTLAVDAAARALQVSAVRATPARSGPRYAAFHPTLPVFYVNYEYQPLIEVFRYERGGGGASATSPYTSLGTVDVLPDDMPGNDRQPGVLLSDLRVHPSGRFVYTLVRGHNVVSAFSVDAATGRLRRIQTAQLQGTSPKGCAPSADGRWLYVAMSASNAVQVWRVGDDGQLEATGQMVTVPRPSAMLAVDL